MAGRRALGPWAITLIVVDVILIGILVVMLVNYPRGDAGDDGGTASAGATTEASGDGTTDEEPTTQAPAVTVPEDALDVAAFSSPSRNIWCEIAQDDATCMIGDITFTPPEVADCDPAIAGHFWQVTAERADPICGAEVPTEAPADLPDLAYGASTVVGDFLCTSETDGVTCVSISTGHGVTIARGGSSQF
ncbi:hypothetical protein EXU48_03665 [Occultella glacieicola]|uniref:Uncharacterized protein n=1 Tax=Occultella glacieicola TaxID=2518684 RepID=A0ABY2E8K1_9MICO|nr:hypothetical protein [Occultella glacieicola]TDE97313.1 hypothetical protein EXU48_03665 [Occultella glacieicola]